MNIFKVAIIGVIGVLLASFLKNAKSQLYIGVSMAVSLIILFYISDRLSGIVSQITYIQKYISIGGEYLTILFKIIGITYITEFAADICRDSGYSAIAGQIELFCKVSIGAISVPLVLVLFETVISCVG